MSLKQFEWTFLLLAKECKLSIVTRTKFLKFIKTILPVGNIIPENFRTILNRINLKNSKKILICPVCLKKLEKNQNCNSDDCKDVFNSKNMQPYSSSAINFSIKNQLSSIIFRNWNLIKNYTG